MEKAMNRLLRLLEIFKLLSEIRYRNGESYFLGFNGKIISSVSWIWKEWLVNGFLTIIAAESGQGKSFLALYIASCFLIKNKFPDGSLIKIEDNCKVLWCEAEAFNLDICHVLK